MNTLLKTNIAPENRPPPPKKLVFQIPIHHFQARTVSFREGISILQREGHVASKKVKFLEEAKEEKSRLEAPRGVTCG